MRVFPAVASRFPRNLCPINLDLQSISATGYLADTARRISGLTGIRDRHLDIDLVPVPWHFRLVLFALRDVRTMLAVLNRNLALTTSSLTITSNRALLMSCLGESLTYNQDVIRNHGCIPDVDFDLRWKIAKITLNISSRNKYLPLQEIALE